MYMECTIWSDKLLLSESNAARKTVVGKDGPKSFLIFRRSTLTKYRAIADKHLKAVVSKCDIKK